MKARATTNLSNAGWRSQAAREALDLEAQVRILAPLPIHTGELTTPYADLRVAAGLPAC